MSRQETAKYRKLSYQHERAIDDAIRANSQIDPDSGEVIYRAGCDDEYIAASIPNTVWGEYPGSRKNAVAGFRSRNIGPLPTRRQTRKEEDHRLAAIWEWANTISQQLGVSPPMPPSLDVIG